MIHRWSFILWLLLLLLRGCFVGFGLGIYVWTNGAGKHEYFHTTKMSSLLYNGRFYCLVVWLRFVSFLVVRLFLLVFSSLVWLPLLEWHLLAGCSNYCFSHFMVVLIVKIRWCFNYLFSISGQEEHSDIFISSWKDIISKWAFVVAVICTKYTLNMQCRGLEWRHDGQK